MEVGWRHFELPRANASNFLPSFVNSAGRRVYRRARMPYGRSCTMWWLPIRSMGRNTLYQNFRGVPLVSVSKFPFLYLDEAKVPSFSTSRNVEAWRGTGFGAGIQRHLPVFSAESKGGKANQTPYEALKALSIQGLAAFRNRN